MFSSAFIAISVFASSLFCTEQVRITGKLKNYDGRPVAHAYKIFIRQGRTALESSQTRKNGSFDFTFYPGSGISESIDVLTVNEHADTILLASLTGFKNEVRNSGNLFLPKPVAKPAHSCPQCGRSDRIYSLVYRAKEQPDLEMHPNPSFCGYDLVRF